MLKWLPMNKYFENPHDWVLVQFEEKETKFRGVPTVAEFRKRKDKQGWFLLNDDDENYFNYINLECEPVAFCEISTCTTQGVGCVHQGALVNQEIHYCELNKNNYPNCQGCEDFVKRPDSITTSTI